MRAETPAGSTDYKEVRALTRGLALLRALSAMPGGRASITALASTTGVHRTTVKRLLETLRAERIVEQGGDGEGYALTFEVRRLSEGYDPSDWIDRDAVPLMFERLPKLLWPSDIATPDSGFMVVRESTHRGSSLSQHRAMIGTRLPMPSTALGRAYLAWCPEAEREGLLELLAARDDEAGRDARNRARIARILSETRRRGYATNDGEWLAQADFGAVALPILVDSRPIAAINLVFPKTALRRPELVRARIPALRALARAIGRKLEERRVR
jgi:IclR family mhp operon transcriptional activator